MSDRVPIGLCLGIYLNPDRDCITKKQKSFGLEYRDKERCLMLEQILDIKAVTLTLDKEKKLYYHIQSNFNTSKHIVKDIEASFPDGSFYVRRVLYMFLEFQ